MFRNAARLTAAGFLVLTSCDGGSGSSDSDPGQNTGGAAAGGHASGDSGAPGGTQITGGAGGLGEGGGQEPARFEATRAELRFKGAARIREDFARVLVLPSEALCTELGRFDCIGDIHQIALGGVEPYEINIFEPFPGLAVGAPLAAERVALTACATRVKDDLEHPEKSIYWGAMPLDGAALRSVDAPEVDAALTKLFREALLREPTAEDLAGLKGLYADVLAEGDATPAATWAQLACMTLLTSTESLLY